MSLHFETDLYKAVVDFGKVAIAAARQMPRDVKMLLGGTLRDEVLWMGVLVRRINIARDAAKLPHIDDLQEHLEIAVQVLRYCRELGFIAPKHYTDALPLTVSIGKQATGLRKHFAPA